MYPLDNMIVQPTVDPLAPTPEDQDAAMEWLGEGCMDIGCGPNPLPIATHLYDLRQWDNPNIEIVDFYNYYDVMYIRPANVYCRHVLEDMRYPEALFLLFTNCERGWIETPHPSLEMARGIDGGLPWRGFSHHYWFIWVEDSTLMFLPKTPMVEHLQINNECLIKRWNTYYKWDNYNFHYKILQHGIDFDYRDNSYQLLLQRGLNS